MIPTLAGPSHLPLPARWGELRRTRPFWARAAREKPSCPFAGFLRRAFFPSVGRPSGRFVCGVWAAVVGFLLPLRFLGLFSVYLRGLMSGVLAARLVSSRVVVMGVGVGGVVQQAQAAGVLA